MASHCQWWVAQTLTGRVLGPGKLTINGGTLEGNFPELELAGPVDLSGDINVSGNLTLTAGSVHINAKTITVGGDFLAAGTGVLEMHHGSDELIVTGDVTFSGGDSAIQIDNAAPLRDGTIYVGGNFVQDGDPRSFAAENKHRVVFNGTGVQTITMNNPDSSNPDPGDPAASGLTIRDTRSRKEWRHRWRRCLPDRCGRLDASAIDAGIHTGFPGHRGHAHHRGRGAPGRCCV